MTASPFAVNGRAREPSAELLLPFDKVRRALTALGIAVDRTDVHSYTAECPAHRDEAREPGEEGLLFLHIARDQRLLVRCQKGCAKEAIVAALGLRLADLYPLDAIARGDVEVTLGEAPVLSEEEKAALLPAPICALFAPPAEPVRFAIEDLWTVGDIGLVVGDGGTFKSTAALAMAAAMAGGYRVWNRFDCLQGPVLVLSAEDAGAVVQMRLEALVAGHDWDRARVLEHVHYIATPDLTLSDPRWQAHVTAHAKSLGVRMVVLDPLADLLDGDENSNSDVRPMLRFARALGRATGAIVPIVHHAGKAGDGKRQIDRIRGASALNAAARTILFFEYHDTGVTVEHLKMSRAPKLPTFVLTRAIRSDPANRALWTSAALTYHDAHDLRLSRTENYVVEYLSTTVSDPTSRSTSGIKQAANRNGFSGQDVSEALKTLQSRGAIAAAESGKSHRKAWFVVAPRSTADG